MDQKPHCLASKEHLARHVSELCALRQDDVDGYTTVLSSFFGGLEGERRERISSVYALLLAAQNRMGPGSGRTFVTGQLSSRLTEIRVQA